MAQGAHKADDKFTQALAHDAWLAHAALIRLAHKQPELKHNEAFTALMDTAKARFLAAFEVL